MHQQEIEILKLFIEDFNYVRSILSPKISPGDLRRLSAITRAFFLDSNNTITQAQKIIFRRSAAIQIQSLKLNMENLLKVSHLSQVTFLSCGGAESYNVKIKEASLFKKALRQEEIQALYSNTLAQKYTYRNIDSYLHDTCLIINSQEIKRRNLMSFIANKKGGVHLDFIRSPKDKKKFKGLDELFDSGFHVAGREAAYFEFLSIINDLFNNDGLSELSNQALEKLENF